MDIVMNLLKKLVDFQNFTVLQLKKMHIKSLSWTKKRTFIDLLEKENQKREEKREQRKREQEEAAIKLDMKMKEKFLEEEFDEKKTRMKVKTVESDKIGIPNEIFKDAMNEDREAIVWRISNEEDLDKYVLVMDVEVVDDGLVHLPSWALLNLKEVGEEGVRVSLMKNPKLEKVAKVVFKIHAIAEEALIMKYEHDTVQELTRIIDDNMHKYDALVEGQELELKSEGEVYVIQVEKIEGEGGKNMKRCITRVISGGKDIEMEFEFASHKPLPKEKAGRYFQSNQMNRI